MHFAAWFLRILEINPASVISHIIIVGRWMGKLGIARKMKASGRRKRRLDIRPRRTAS